MLRSSWLVSAAVIASLTSTGCSQPRVEHPVPEVTAEDVRRDTSKAADTALKAASQAQEDFMMRLKSNLADMDTEIAKLHEKGLALKDEARTRWNATMADLEVKRDALLKQVDELGKSTGAAWERLEEGAQSAWDDLQKAYQEASKEF